MINPAIYTDGSCDTQSEQGAWVAIILTGEEKIVLSGKVPGTTHNRMELTAVIEGITYVQKKFRNIKSLDIYSDSQYVTGLMARQDKLRHKDFVTNKGTEVRNADLVKELFKLGAEIQLIFTKVKAHQKEGEDVNYNIAADKLVRKIMREERNRGV